MEDLKTRLATLNKNLNILREREAKYGGNAPLELLNQIDDHLQAIDLVQAAIAGELTEAELEVELAPLNLAVTSAPQINLGDVEGSYLAIGNGAKLIVNHALSAIEEAQKQNDYEQAMLAEAVINLATRLQEIVSQESELEKHRNPYKSLLDYRLEDAPFFYGRSQAIMQTLDRIGRNPLTVLHAESGAGKTSLLQAGLAPRLLIYGNLPLHVRAWNVNPTLAIKRAILPNLEQTPGLAQTPLLDFLRKVTHVLGTDGTLYIFLDQFEEFFTLLDENTRTQFVKELGDCLDDESLHVRWVLAMRKEFFGNLATFRPRIRNPFANDYLLHAMTQAEATEVIVEPAKKQGVTYEPALIEQILADLGTDLDGAPAEVAPPQIQLVCATLFDELLAQQTANPEIPPLITPTMYREEGGAQGILRGHLNRVLRRTFSEAERELARRLLIALVSSDQRRVRRTRADLTATLSLYLTSAATLDEMLEQLINSRLLRVEGDEETDVPAYELAHDYLLTEIEVDPEVQAQKAAQELLDREVETFKRHNIILNRQQYEIINSQLDKLVVNEEAKELLRLSKAEKNRQMRNRIVMAAASFIVLIFLAVGMFIQRNQARNAERIARARHLSAQATNFLDTDSELSLLLALEAVNYADTVEAEDTLRHVLTKIHPWETLSTSQAIYSAAWTPDGKQVALALENGDIQLWDAQTKTQLKTLSGHTDSIYTMEFNKWGTYLISAPAGDEPDDALRVWDVGSGQTVGTLAGHGEATLGVAWRPDGNVVLSGGVDKMVKLWDITTMQPITALAGHTGEVWDVAWRPDGQKFASVDEEGEIFIWDTNTLTVETVFTGHQGIILDVTWSPDGQRLATAGADSTVRVWDTVHNHILDVLSGHNSWVRSVDWHPDGQQLVSSADDNKVILWDSKNSRAVIVLTGHTNWVRQAAWNPAGTHILSASEDQTARIWDMRGSPGVMTLRGHQGEAKNAVWNPAGTLLASAGNDGTVRIWNPDTGQNIAILKGHQDLVHGVAWSPDGTKLVSVSSDENAYLWSAITMQNMAVLTGHTDQVYIAAWSPDGQLLATGGADKTIRLWDVEEQNATYRQTLTGHTRSVLGLDFSPDGLTLASGSSDNTIIFWNPTTGQQIQTFEEHTSFVWDVAFSTDGQLLASASQDATIRIRDLANGQTLYVIKHPSPVNMVDWSPNGLQLATAADDMTARIWDNRQKEFAVANLSGHQGGVWSVAWSPDGARLATASTDGVIRIFRTDFQEILELAQQNKHRNLTDEEREKLMGQAIFMTGQ